MSLLRAGAQVPSQHLPVHTQVINMSTLHCSTYYMSTMYFSTCPHCTRLVHTVLFNMSTLYSSCPHCTFHVYTVPLMSKLYSLCPHCSPHVHIVVPTSTLYSPCQLCSPHVHPVLLHLTPSLLPSERDTWLGDSHSRYWLDQYGRLESNQLNYREIGVLPATVARIAQALEKINLLWPLHLGQFS